MNWFNRLQAWLRPDPQTIINTAITRAAQLCGELEEARTRAEYYRVLLVNCDPHQEWWRFANLKQRQHDAHEDIKDIGEHYMRACVDVESLIQAQKEAGR